MTRITPRLTIVAATLAAASTSAFAASGIWSNPATGGLWSDGANWASSVVADGSGSSADFSTLDITGDTTVLMDAPHTLSTLKFGDTSTGTAGGWILSNNGNAANILTLDGAANVTVGSLGSNKSATISAVIAGTAGLTADGAGTLTLSGNNTYAGTTWVKGAAGTSSGTIRFSSAANLGVDTSAIRIGQAGSSSGVLWYNGAGETFSRGIDISGNATLDASGTGNWNIAGNVSVSGGNLQSLTLQGSGVGTIANLTQNGATASPLTKTGAGTWILSGTNTFTGTTTITNGTLQFASGASFGGATSAIVMGQSGASTGTFKYTGAGDTLARGFSLNGNGILDASGTGALTITGNVVVTGGYNQTLDLRGTGSGIYSGSIGQNGATTSQVRKSGAGTWTLSGANTYAGGTAISGGTLVTGNVSALGVGAGTVSVTGAGTTLQIGSGGVTLGSGATLTIGSGSILKFTDAASVIATTGGYTLTTGAIIDLNGGFAGSLNQTYNLITGTGTKTDGSIVVQNGAAGYAYNFAQGILTVTAVPEPSTYGLLGAGALAAVALVRRRRKGVA